MSSNFLLYVSYYFREYCSFLFQGVYNLTKSTFSQCSCYVMWFPNQFYTRAVRFGRDWVGAKRPPGSITYFYRIIQIPAIYHVGCLYTHLHNCLTSGGIIYNNILCRTHTPLHSKINFIL